MAGVYKKRKRIFLTILNKNVTKVNISVKKLNLYLFLVFVLFMIVLKSKS